MNRYIEALENIKTNGFDLGLSNEDYAALDAAIESLAWFPIESAPNDGSVVLLCDKNGNQWTDVSPGECWIENACGHSPLYWKRLPILPDEIQP